MSGTFLLVEPPGPHKPPLHLEATLPTEATKVSLPTLLNLLMYKLPISNQPHFIFNV